MSNTTAARRYAKALFTLSSEQGVVDAVHADLENLSRLKGQVPGWKTFVNEPIGSLEKRARILDALLKDRVHPLTHRFFTFLDQKRRIGSLADIHTEWQKLYDDSKDILRARVMSAVTLTESQLTTLNEKLAGRFGKKIMITTGLDPSLIGGMKIFIGDQVFDHSLESQLQLLQKKMIYA